jgi:HAE1 family hydrophobic/amphiphilic exporter-1
MKTIRILICVLLGAGCLAEGLAQDAQTALTVEAAVALALARNPEILVALAQRDELVGRIKEIRSEAFPQVTFEGSGLRMRDPSILNSSSFDNVPQEFRDALVPVASNMFDLGLTVKQPLWTAGKIRTAVKLAEESLAERNAVSESVRQQLAFRVLQAFNELFLMEANRDVVRETRQQRLEHLQQAQGLFDSGVATEIDVLRSKVNVANMEPDLIRAENRVRLARAEINKLIMEDLEAPTKIAGGLEYKPWDAGILGDVQKQALELRPELQAARRQVQQARLTLALANAQNKLTVDMDGHYGYSVREIQNMFVNDYSRWNITVNFKLPVYDGGRKAGLMIQAQARLRAAEQSLAQLENDCRLEVKRAYDDMETFSKAISAARLSVQQAEKVRTLMQANYKYGAATTLDVTDSQTALVEARNSEIAATYQYEMAKARLRLASGSPILDREVIR